MKWMILAGGILFVLAALMALIGFLLPVKHYATRKARFQQTPEAIKRCWLGHPAGAAM